MGAAAIRAGFCQRRICGEAAEWFKAAVLNATGIGDRCA